MKSIKLLAILLALTICVSTSYGQETETKSDKEDFTKVAKMLHGVWAGDTEKTAEEIKKMENEVEQSMVEMMLERVGTIEISFQDGKFDVVIGDQKMAGDWKVKAAEKKDDVQTLTIHVIPDDESEGQDKNFEIHFIGEKHMKMIDLDDEGPPIVLGRKALMEKDN